MSARRFKVLGELGKGGFGRVFHVVEEGSDLAPPLALKLLTGRWPADADPARRLRDEARLLARLRHPGIVRLYSMIQLDAGPGLLMELVEGPNLAQALRLGGPAPLRVALEIVAAVAEALVYALELPGPDGAPLGLQHRDIKPANLAITRHGEVKLLDFGIAWADLRAREAQSGPEPRGTPTYMAPERQRGQGSATADVYALGLVLANLLTGQEHPDLPTDPDDQARFQRELGGQILAALPTSARSREMVGALVLSCVEWEPEARPSARDVAELAGALALEGRGEPFKTWAAGAVPPLSAAVAAHAEAMAVGTVMCERVPSGEGGGAVALVETEVEAGQGRGGGLVFPARPSLDAPAPVVRRAPPPRVERRWAARLGPALIAALVLLVPASPEAPVTDVTPVLQTDAPLVQTAPPAPAPVPACDTPIAAPRAPPTPAAAALAPAPHPAAPVLPEVPVGLSGDAERVELVGAQTYALPAQVLPGDYALRVTFAGIEPYQHDPQPVRAGARYEVRCLQAMVTCRLVETP